jgi:hypothetical protein
MADFACQFCEPPALQHQMQADPTDHPAVIMPLTLVDNASPKILNILPPPPGPLTKHQALQFRLLDDRGLYALRELWIRFGNASSYDLVHDGTSFLGFYEALSTITPVTDGWDLSIRRNIGWPLGAVVKLKVSVVDSGGNVVVIDV